MKRIRVRAGNQNYPIVIHSNQLRVGRIPKQLHTDGGRVILITDKTVAKFHLKSTTDRLEKMGLRAEVITVRPGERSKRPGMVVRLAQEMLAKGANRKTPVVALGGGVVGDLAGLVASLFMRGVPLVHIPTTLLAQVDSSIGGKTGVDLPEGKNLLGTFWPPLAVWTWLGYLKTLPPRRVREGLSEALKYGYIYDPPVLELATGIDPRNPLATPDALGAMVERCAAAKAEIVSRDEREGGLREILNFGHTLGHALERVMGYHQITHGEAVAIGMMLELKLSRNSGHTEPGIVEDLKERLVKLGLPHHLPDNVTIQELVDAARHDKKKTRNDFRIIGIRDVGKTEIMNFTAAELSRALSASI
jgi:3-dehydroquinate synthase